VSDETGKADWFAMSTEILEDDKLEILRERHGNDALAVVIKLMCKAKLQRKGGVAKVNLRSLASDAHVDRPVAKAILEDAAEVGFIEFQELTEVSATVQLKGWNRWQQNFRQQKSREARKATTDADVTSGHDLSHDVTNSTRQDKTEQNKKKKAAPAIHCPRIFHRISLPRWTLFVLCFSPSLTPEMPKPLPDWPWRKSFSSTRTTLI